MIKLFVVEDEIIMRNGLKKINWEMERVELVGDASDGEIALPMILESRPDILITDIKMPFMDGLELSERVKKELPDTQIIILSGFDEFSYAQKAVSLGITEYLLKPVTPVRLVETVREVCKKIEEQRKNRNEMDFADGVPEEKVEFQKQRLFRHLVMNTKSSSELLDMAAQIGINLTARYFCVLLISIQIDGVLGSEYSQTRNDFQAILSEVFAQTDGWTLVDRGENGFAAFIARNHEDTLRDSIRQNLDQFCAQANTMTGCYYFIGVGSVVNRVSEIQKSYENATRAASYRFLMERNRIVYAENLQTGDTMQTGLENQMDFNESVTNMDFRKIFENFLLVGSVEETKPLMAEIFLSVGEKNTKSIVFMTYLVMDMYLTILRYAKENEIDTAEIEAQYGDVHELIKNDISRQRAVDYLVDYVSEVLTRRDQKKEKRYSRALLDTISYIDENFDKDDITLSRIAAIANLSPNHYSSIFSQEMGVTFMEYVINKRITKACQLLMTTELRSSEIAYEVGYKDPHYFSHTFKKNMGMSPKEYRMKGGKGTE